MVLTRQQQRRQASLAEHITSLGATDASMPILGMGDREDSERRPRDAPCFPVRNFKAVKYT